MRKREIIVPDDVNIEIRRINPSEVEVIVKGPKGELNKKLKGKRIEVSLKEKDGKKVVDVECEEIAMINTSLSHIENMIVGVREGFVRKMVVRYSHFPMNLEVKGNELIIKNFLGERVPRRARIVGNTSVKVKGQELFVEGINKEEVSQTVANIRQATKIKKKDFRVFQDGIYPIS